MANCEHPEPTFSCFGYRHITCPDCGRTVCAGCQSLDPKQPTEPPPKEKPCRRCGGTGLEPKTEISCEDEKMTP